MKKWRSYPRYKDSGVEWLGEVPEHWEVKRIRRIFKAINGSTPSSGVPEYWDGDIAWVTPDDLGQMLSDTITETARYITNLGYDSCGTKLAPVGSLVLSTRAPIGHLAIAGVDLCTNQGCRSLVFRSSDNGRFFYYHLIAARSELQSWGQGSTFSELGKDKLQAILLACPKITEQERVASFLDRETAKIDTLTAKKNRMIELLNEKRTAVIGHAVTKGLDPDAPTKDSGVEWLGKIPKQWEIRPLKSNFRFEKGKDSQKFTAVYLADNVGDYPVYSGQTENNGVMERISTYIYDLQEVIFVTTVGAKVMTPMVLKGRFNLSQNCLIMIPKNDLFSVKYFFYCLQPCFAFEKGAIPSYMQPSLRISDLNKYSLAYPPHDEQRAIVSFLDHETTKIDALTAKIGEAIEKLKEYHTALISAAVTGRIDVREEVQA